MVKRNGLPAGVFLNVNVPTGRPKGLRVAAQSMETGHETWVEHKNPRGRRYFWDDYREPEQDANLTTDVAALAQGCVAVTPLHATEYDRPTANRLKALIKSRETTKSRGHHDGHDLRDAFVPSWSLLDLQGVRGGEQRRLVEHSSRELDADGQPFG